MSQTGQKVMWGKVSKDEGRLFRTYVCTSRTIVHGAPNQSPSFPKKAGYTGHCRGNVAIDVPAWQVVGGKQVADYARSSLSAVARAHFSTPGGWRRSK